MSASRNLDSLRVAQAFFNDNRTLRKHVRSPELDRNEADGFEDLIADIFDAVLDAPHLMRETAFVSIYDALVGHFVDESLFEAGES